MPSARGCHTLCFVAEQAVEYRDIRLRPKLNKVCSEERAVYCKVRCPAARRSRHTLCASTQAAAAVAPEHHLTGSSQTQAERAVGGLTVQDVKPGKARVVKCLMENLGEANFGEECKVGAQAPRSLPPPRLFCAQRPAGNAAAAL